MGICFSGRNWLDFSVGDRNWLDFGVGLGIDLVFVWVVEIDLFLLYGPKMTRFWCGHRKWLGFCVRGRNWFDFSVGERNELDFRVWMVIDLVFVWGSKLTWWIRAANRSVLVGGSKLIWLLCGWSKLTWFECGGSILYKRKKYANASNFKSQSALNEWLSVLFVIYKRKRSGVQPHRFRISTFSEMHLHTRARRVRT